MIPMTSINTILSSIGEPQNNKFPLEGTMNKLPLEGTNHHFRSEAKSEKLPPNSIAELSCQHLETMSIDELTKLIETSGPSFLNENRIFQCRFLDRGTLLRLAHLTRRMHQLKSPVPSESN